MERKRSQTPESDNKKSYELQGHYRSHCEELAAIKQEPDFTHVNHMNIKQEPDMIDELPYSTERVAATCCEPDIHGEQIINVKQETVTSDSQDYCDGSGMRNEHCTCCEGLTGIKEEDSVNLAVIKHEPDDSNEIFIGVEQEDEVYHKKESDLNYQIPRDNEETADTQRNFDSDEGYNHSVPAKTSRLDPKHNILQIVPLTTDQGNDEQFTVLRRLLIPHDSNTPAGTSIQDCEPSKVSNSHSPQMAEQMQQKQGKDAHFTVLRSLLNPYDSNAPIDSGLNTEINQGHKPSEVLSSQSPQMTEKTLQSRVVHPSEKPDICQYPSEQTGLQQKHKKLYFCDLCPYTCKKPSSLKKHKITHTGEKPFACDMCSHTFTEIGNLNKHKMTHSGKKPYSCDMCEYTCKHPYQLKQHKLIHTGERPYSCDMCSFSCRDAKNLKQHKQTHICENPYSCDMCDYTCRTVRDMHRHKKTHLGDKPISCDLCDFTCKRSRQLRRHELIHTCNVCSYTCREPADLEQHKLMHSVEKTYSCDICQYTCDQAGQLYLHRMIHASDSNKMHTDE